MNIEIPRLIGFFGRRNAVVELRKILITTLVDDENKNAQISNAKMILRYWQPSDYEFDLLHGMNPDSALLGRNHYNLIKLWPWRFWRAGLFSRYFRHYDGIFYPQGDVADIWGLRLRKFLGFKSRLIMTLEGLMGYPEDEEFYSRLAGHPVYCQRPSSDKKYKRYGSYCLKEADHIIAISPFLGRMGQARFGSKFSVLPLGINTTLFYRRRWELKARLKIVSAGGVKTNKRPELFLELARRYPQADFAWYGEGDMRAGLLSQAAQLGVDNLSFPGAFPPRELGEAFRAADIFVMPSKSEGVPKVSQEAAACGLAQVIFGYYEAPTVVHGHNGFVVWSDEEFMEKVEELIGNPALVKSFGCAGAEMAVEWGWSKVAQLWYERLAEVVEKR